MTQTCPSCHLSPPEVLLVPCGTKNNLFDLYFCTGCRTILENDGTGTLKEAMA